MAGDRDEAERCSLNHGAGTWLMVDGEDIAYERIYIEVHPGLCSVITA